MGLECAFAGSHCLAIGVLLTCRLFLQRKVVASLAVSYRVLRSLFIFSVKAITLIRVHFNSTHCHMARDPVTGMGFV